MHFQKRKPPKRMVQRQSLWRKFDYSNHQNWRHTAGRGAFSAAEAPKTQEALMAFKFLGQRQLGKLPSRWVSTILMVAIGRPPLKGEVARRARSRRDARRRRRGSPRRESKSAGGSTRPKGGIPPAGNQIRRRHLVRPTGRRERAITLPPQGR